MTGEAYQPGGSDSIAGMKPEMGRIGLPITRVVARRKARTTSGGDRPSHFTADQFSLFPEICGDWSIEMKWAGDITPRKNFREDRSFCLEVKRVSANWSAALALKVVLKEHAHQEETHFNLFEHQPGMESAGLMRVCRLQECCLPLFDPDLID